MSGSFAARAGAGLLCGALAGPVAAEEFHAQITPYAWGTGIGGSITPIAGGPSLRFREGLSDVLEDLDGAFFVSGLLRYGRFVAIGDLSASSSSRQGVVPGLGSPAKGRLEQASLTLAAGYRALESRKATVDYLLGLRYWNVEARATTPVPGLAGRLDVDFTDPIIAVRANIRLSDRWSLIGYADIGGFGIGSDMTSQVLGTVNWEARDRLYLSVGYRHLFVDYDDGGRGVEARFSGPLLGLSLTF